MIVEVKIPSPGESISEVEMAEWFVESGDYVEKDQEIGEIESDKATLPLMASDSGEIEIVLSSGDTASVGDTACKIDTDAQKKEKSKKQSSDKKDQDSKKESGKQAEEKEKKSAEEAEEKEKSEKNTNKTDDKKDSSQYDKVKVSPVAKKMMQENNLSIEDVMNGLKRIGKNEIDAVVNQKESIGGVQQKKSREEERSKMSQLRKKISQRLVSVKNETAMLTTFNEADMTNIMALRKKYQSKFVDKHDIKLGFMSFFAKAAAIALKTYPKVNSMIDGDEIATPNYADIGFAVQTDKGLMVPVLRNVESLSLAEIEQQIAEIAQRARKGRISIEEMSGGTFTITNGGVFGSLLSTPIINPPQSAILGMHNIVERPVAIDGQVVIRPMMYLAVSYDHRVIDGKDSVTFLVKIKELIENPQRMLLQGGDADKQLLGL